MAGNFAFNKEAIKLLISLYEQHPVLYNPQHTNYKNKSLKQEEYKKITKTFSETWPEVTLADVQKKIQNLRTQFFQEMNRYKKSLLSGAGRTDIYKPTWLYFDDLMFLNINNPIRKGESNLEVNEASTSTNTREILDEDTIIFEGPVDELSEGILSPEGIGDALSPISSCSSTIKKRKKGKETSHGPTELFLKEATEALRATSTGSAAPELLELDAFGQMVAAEMKSIKSRKIRNMLKRKILNLIYEAQEEEMEM